MTDRLRVGACLSLSGKFAQFGRQAAEGLETWRYLDGAAELVIEDDQSDRQTLETVLPGVAVRCDILLGPYSTQLMRAAGRMAAESGWLMWNQGGSGDDVEGAHPGHVVSVLTPTSRYAEPFLQRLASGDRGAARPVHRSGAWQLRPSGGRWRGSHRASAKYPHVSCCSRRPDSPAGDFGRLGPRQRWRVRARRRASQQGSSLGRAAATGVRNSGRGSRVRPRSGRP